MAINLWDRDRKETKMFMLKKNAQEYVYKNLLTIAAVEEQRIDSKIKIPRDQIKVCVIDDEGFDMNTLYDLGYKNIRRKLQFENMDEYQDFDIILCDVEGIGVSVDAEKQGLAVAEQIKNVYPEKVILLYSGKNIETFGEMPSNLDGYLRKQSSMSELAKSLDEIIYVFLTIFLYLLKCPQSLILSALRAFCFCGKPHISRSIFLYFRYQAWLKSW